MIFLVFDLVANVAHTSSVSLRLLSLVDSNSNQMTIAELPHQNYCVGTDFNAISYHLAYCCASSLDGSAAHASVPPGRSIVLLVRNINHLDAVAQIATVKD